MARILRWNRKSSPSVGLGRRLAKTAGVMACAIAAACTARPQPAAWYEAQAVLISSTVLLDVADATPELQREPRPVLCVSLGEDLETPPRDPDARLLSMLREKTRSAYPASDCEITAAAVRHKASGAEAVLFGVSSPEWKEDDFVRVKAWRFVNGLNAVSWVYTLHLNGHTWSVGTVKTEKVAVQEAAPEAWGSSFRARLRAAASQHAHPRLYGMVARVGPRRVFV